MDRHDPETGCALIGLVTVVMVLLGAIVAALVLLAYVKAWLPW